MPHGAPGEEGHLASQHLAVAGPEVGHQRRVGHTLGVHPLEDLIGPEPGRHAPLAQPVAQRLGCVLEDVMLGLAHGDKDRAAWLGPKTRTTQAKRDREGASLRPLTRSLRDHPLPQGERRCHNCILKRRVQRRRRSRGIAAQPKTAITDGVGTIDATRIDP